jgi:hypothetical protein
MMAMRAFVQQGISAGVRVSVYGPELEDYAASYGGLALVDELRAAERRRLGAPAGAANGPELQLERLDTRSRGRGHDHAWVLPEQMFIAGTTVDPRKRHRLQQAVNHHVADRWRRHRAWATPVAGILLTTPEEAIAQLMFVTRRLGFEAIGVSGELPATAAAPAADYDGFWEKVVAAGVLLFADGASFGWQLDRTAA